MLKRLAASKDGLGGLPTACYYGCLSLRNPRITGARNWEMPENLEKIITALGATPVSWSHKTECCSGSLTMARPDIAERLVGDIVGAARRGGAQAMVTDCPMCQANVEGRQQYAETAAALPVYFISELILAAMEGKHSDRQQKLHLVPADILAGRVTTRAIPKGDGR
jgi:heterodisulfide reductase subunit B